VGGSPVSSVTGLAGPSGTGTPGPTVNPAIAALTPLATGSATTAIVVAATVTPSAVAVGNVTLNLALQPPRHMFDQAGMVAADPAQQSSDASKNQNVGSAVFPGGMIQVTNNVDALQPVAADSPQSIVRHVTLAVKTKDHDQSVPYLGVTMDVLLDGHPVLYDQALVPMVPIGQASPQLYYGNNVRFPQRGSYQVFVRMQRNPLLGTGQPPAAQFNLILQ
jgi:hypothetical protein